MARKRSDFERENDLELISKLYLQGWTQVDIASHIAEIRDYELSQSTISNDLALVQWRWKDSTALSLDEHKAKELARIDLLEREYWSEYEKSKQPKKTKNILINDNKSNLESLRIEERTGDARYLQGIERCIKLRMDLLGLYAPKEIRIEIINKLVAMLVTLEIDPDEFLQATVRRLENAD